MQYYERISSTGYATVKTQHWREGLSVAFIELRIQINLQKQFKSIEKVTYLYTGLSIHSFAILQIGINYTLMATESFRKE